MPDRIPGPLFVELEFAVRTYDIDFAGHVSNISYIRWLEDLRNAVLEEYYPIGPAMESGIMPTLSRTDISYRSPILLFEPVVGRMWAGKAGAVRIDLHATFTVGDRVCAEAVQQGVFASMETGRPVRIPPEILTVYRAQQMMLGG